MSSQNKKYYLGFTFERKKQVGLHCTHCYFGTLNKRELETVIDVVNGFFKRHKPIVMKDVIFDLERFFSDQNGAPTVRVLTTNKLDAFEAFTPLREAFENMGLIKSKYPFTPHVTTIDDIAMLFAVFYDYSLVCNGVKIKSWPIENEVSL